MSRTAARPAWIAFAGLAALNLISVVGLGWFVASMLIHEGVMVIELSICLGLIATLVALTCGAFILHRRGAVGAALALLAVGALPTAGAIGFLCYLEANPIDWK